MKTFCVGTKAHEYVYKMFYFVLDFSPSTFILTYNSNLHDGIEIYRIHITNLLLH